MQSLIQTFKDGWQSQTEEEKRQAVLSILAVACFVGYLGWLFLKPATCEEKTQKLTELERKRDKWMEEENMKMLLATYQSYEKLKLEVYDVCKAK